jgi:hypothetical protein
MRCCLPCPFFRGVLVTALVQDCSPPRLWTTACLTPRILLLVLIKVYLRRPFGLMIVQVSLLLPPPLRYLLLVMLVLSPMISFLM